MTYEMTTEPTGAPDLQRTALVLGGYGLIGSACLRSLASAGFEVVGMGRSEGAARVANQSIPWVIRDLTTVSVEEWRSLLNGVDVVVNAAGALQDGARDRLEAIHVTAIQRLLVGAKGLPVRIVQISAAGVSIDATTAFYRTKALGDAHVARSAADWVILRPTLVLSPDAYGGTALLRAMSGLPLILPRVLPDARVQTVHIDDLVEAVLAAAMGQVPTRTTFDVTARQVHRFDDLTRAFRSWLGLPPARFRPNVPDWMLQAMGRLADALGLLGWRSPLRTSALVALRSGIVGDLEAYERFRRQPLRELDASLMQIPSSRQERVFARAYLALPIAIGVLAVFWIASGLITLAAPAQAIAVLHERQTAPGLSTAIVFVGAVADILLGCAVLWRPWAKRALLGMIGLSTLYLAGSLFLAPDLWLDPLGPMVKVLPAIALAGMAWLLMEDR